jgi:hypothetical protein
VESRREGSQGCHADGDKADADFDDGPDGELGVGVEEVGLIREVVSVRNSCYGCHAGALDFPMGVSRP